MELIDIAAILWIALAGYGFSVLHNWKQTASYTREKLAELIEEYKDE